MVSLGALGGAFGSQAALADDMPGTDAHGVGTSHVQFGSIAPVVTETGKISWSLDGLGTLTATGQIQVQKPAGATVRRAFLGAASTGFSGRKLANGDVSLDGTALTWGISTASSIQSWNHWTEVTSLVKAKVDAAPAGLVNFTITEVNTAGIDGEVLGVIFDDPSQATINTVVLLFGAQQISGDTFNIALSDPLNLSDPNLRLDMSLGISYGFITGSTVNQFSTVDVNGNRLTSSAGGQDDGQSGNGALITVGGIGDTNANPAANTQTPPGPADNYRFDDELYDLKPFVKTGDTTITVFTRNPSTDDNIFFSGLFIGSAAAIVGEGIVLGPATATLSVGTTQTATATVQDAAGHPVAGRAVTFKVLAGPNAGQTAVATTDASGKASYSYVGAGGPGVDEIQATFIDSAGKTSTSNTALREWIQVHAPPVASCRNVTRPVDATCTAPVLAADVGAGSTDPDGDPLAFALAPAGPFSLGMTSVTMTASDPSGLSASCSAVVTAVDATAPDLTVPGSASGCGSSAAVAFAVSATDNCGAVAPVCTDASGRTVASGATFPAGTTTVTCIAKDAANNTTTKTFAVTVKPSCSLTPPSCALTAVVAGPPKQLQITVQDPGDGIQSIEVTESANTTVAVPSFTVGEKGGLVVVATKINQSAGSSVALRITDVNGAVTNCDPVVPGDVNQDPSSDSAGANGGFGCAVGPFGRGTGFSVLVGGLLAGLALMRRRRDRQ